MSSDEVLKGRIYTYAIVVDGVVRYIGKGSGYRIREHQRIARRANRVRESGGKFNACIFHNRLAKAIRNGSRVEEVVISFFESHEDALDYEAAEVESREGLWNSKSGGGENIKADDYVREKIRKSTIERYKDPSERKKTSEALKIAFSSDEARAMLSDRSKAAWVEHRDTMLAAIKKIHKDESANAKKSAYQKEAWKSEGRRKRMSDMSKAMWSDSEHKQAHVEALKESWKSPERKAKHRAYWDSEDGRNNLSRASRAAAASHRARKVRRSVMRGAPIWAGLTRVQENAA